MAIPLLQVDAFTALRYAGNPAGVCLLAAAADPRWMQAVAAEVNAAETAFVVRTGEAAFDLRWFSPTVEIPLCGHATLATAHVLFEQGLAAADRVIEFATASGPLRAWQGGDGWIEMDFPAARFEAVAPGSPEWGTAEELGRALRTEIVGAARGGRNWLLLTGNVAGVLGADPDFARAAELGDMITLTAAVETEASGTGLPPAADGADFVSRTFVPAWGIPEDPVTGSAHCALGPFWQARLGRAEMTGYQASLRGGVVRVRVAGERAILGGRAITVFRGELAD
jgi:PhzF family phenazine biosynthesis protein